MEFGIMAILQVMSAMLTYATHREDNQRQVDLLENEQDFQREREDINYERNLYADKDRFDLLVNEMGVNPNIAMNSILGGSGSSPAVTDSSPSAPSVNSLSSVLGPMLEQGVGKFQDLFLQQAQIRNLNADANKKDVEAGILPRDYLLREMSTEKQIEVWSKSVEKMSSEIGLNEESKKLVEQQNIYYGRKTEAEINVLMEQANKAVADAKLSYQKIEESKAQTRELDARTAVDYAQVENINASTANIRQDTMLKGVEMDLTWQKSERERIAKEFEQKMSGIPLTADARQHLNYLVSEGKYDDASKFLDCIFQSALNQKVGENVGEYISKPAVRTFGLPFGIYEQTDYNRGRFNRFVNPNGIPFWSPTWITH